MNKTLPFFLNKLDMRQIECEVSVSWQYLSPHEKSLQLVELAHERVYGVEEALHV